MEGSKKPPSKVAAVVTGVCAGGEEETSLQFTCSPRHNLLYTITSSSLRRNSADRHIEQFRNLEPILEQQRFLSLFFTNINQESSFPSKMPTTPCFLCHYQFQHGWSQILVLHQDTQTGLLGVNRSLSFTTNNYVQVLSSCGGRILLSSFGETDEPMLHVFNPMTQQSVTLPQHGIARCRKVVRSGLAVDGEACYQVVLVHVADDDDAAKGYSGGVGIEVYSSKTGKWRSCRDSHLSFLVSVPRFEFPELTTFPLFSNGAIHWEIDGHLLVYRVQDDHCELIELPNLLKDWCWQSTMTYKRCLWESQGRVHYAYTDVDGVHIWVLLGEDDHDYYSFYGNYDRKKFRWALEHTIKHQNMNPIHQEFAFHLGQWEPHNVSPVALAEDSETLYLKLPGFLVSYNTRTGVKEEVCGFTYPGIEFNCCSFFPFAYGNSSSSHPATASESFEVVFNLPVEGEFNALPF